MNTVSMVRISRLEIIDELDILILKEMQKDASLLIKLSLRI